MDENFKIRSNGVNQGPFSFAELYRMSMRRDIDHTAEFWSERDNTWKSITGILQDLYPNRLEQMKESGITQIEILGGGEDCPECSRLIGIVCGIDEVPDLPPADCTCVPWCGCIVIARE